MSYCPNCGSPMNDGAKFCPNCGNQVNQQQSQPQSQPQHEPQNQAQHEPQSQPQSHESILNASAVAGEVVLSSWENPNPQPQYQQPYQQPQPQPQPNYVVQQSPKMSSQSGVQPGVQSVAQPATPPRKKNGIGTAGFVLSLIGLLFSWFPPVSALPWFLGLLFSFIGLFKRPKPLAIIGLIFSLITVVIFIILISVVGTSLGDMDFDSLFNY